MNKKYNESIINSAVTVEQMRRADAYTIANFVDSKELMYRAAMGIYNSFDWTGKRIAIVTGSGNNGGDGYALSGILSDNKIDCTVFRTSDKFSEDGKYYFDMAVSKGVKSTEFDKNVSFEKYDVIVDCMLGTGFCGVPRGNIKLAIDKINSSDAFVISADINSGMNGDTGEAEVAVKSDLTVSIGFYKVGMFKGQAEELIGELINVDIGIVTEPETV